MKKFRVSKVILLLSTGLLSQVNAEISLKLDRDLVAGNYPAIPVLSLDGNTQYQIGTSQINMNALYPVICNRIGGYVPITNVHTRITDPNGDNKGDDGTDLSVMGIQSNVRYSIGRKEFTIKSENRSKSICLSHEEFDVIYDHDFSDGTQTVNPDLTYAYINEPVGGYTPGSLMNYEITYENNTGSEQTVDLIEYYAYTSDSDAYFTPGAGQNCSILDANDDPVNGASCFIFDGVVNDVVLQPTQKVRMSISRLIDPGSTVGSDMQMMAAVFPKVNTIDSFGGGTSFAGFDTIFRLIPIVADN